LCRRSPDHERGTGQQVGEVVEHVADFIAQQNNAATSRASQLDKCSIPVTVARAAPVWHDEELSRGHASEHQS
jgi:hypothetical protein